jgi:DNA-directed RNA polymerase sigma subunit (sigma70/sigma32)
MAKPKREIETLSFSDPEAALLASDDLDPTIDRRITIEWCMVKLKPRERYILRRRFGFDGDFAILAELSEELKVTGARIRGIEQHALGKLASGSTLRLLRQVF